MTPFACTAGIFVLVISGMAAAYLVRRRKRSSALEALRAQAASEPLELRSTFPTVVSAQARHLATILMEASADAKTAGLQTAAGDLGVTDREVVFGVNEAIALSRVREAVLLPVFEGRAAGEFGALLRVSWTRGGVRLASVFAVPGGRLDAERVRKEIHIRVAMASR